MGLSRVRILVLTSHILLGWWVKFVWQMASGQTKPSLKSGGYAMVIVPMAFKAKNYARKVRSSSRLQSGLLAQVLAILPTPYLQLESPFGNGGGSGVGVWVEDGVGGAPTLFIIALRIQHSAVHKIRPEGTGVDIKGLQVIAPTEYSR